MNLLPVFTVIFFRKRRKYIDLQSIILSVLISLPDVDAVLEALLHRQCKLRLTDYKFAFGNPSFQHFSNFTCSHHTGHRHGGYFLTPEFNRTASQFCVADLAVALRNTMGIIMPVIYDLGKQLFIRYRSVLNDLLVEDGNRNAQSHGK